MLVGERIHSADYWCDRAEQIDTKFRAIVGSSAFEFVDNLCTALFTTNHDNNTIRDPLLTIARLRGRLRKCQDRILQLSGAGSEWERSEDIARAIGRVVTALEEALCLAEAGHTEFATSHAEGGMWYQLEKL